MYISEVWKVAVKNFEIIYGVKEVFWEWKFWYFGA